MCVFQEAKTGHVFKDKNEDYLRYFKAIILGHNDQYPCVISSRLNKQLISRNQISFFFLHEAAQSTVEACGSGSLWDSHYQARC